MNFFHSSTYSYLVSLIPFSIKRFISWIFLKFYNPNTTISLSNSFLLLDILNKKVKIWKWTFIGRSWYFFAGNNIIKIWKYCSIAGNVFMITYNHPTEYITMSSIGGVIKQNQEFKKWDIVIWNDVRIWQNVTILPGINIGNGAIIWAGSVVTKNIPPYAIAWWNPCKVLKYRFSEKWIEYVESLQRWNWDEEKIKQNEKLFNIKIE